MRTFSVLAHEGIVTFKGKSGKFKHVFQKQNASWQLYVSPSGSDSGLGVCEENNLVLQPHFLDIRDLNMWLIELMFSSWLIKHQNISLTDLFYRITT